MSDNRITIGVMAKLETPFLEEDRQEVQEIWEEQKIPLQLNYDANIVVYVHQDMPGYQCGLVFFEDNIMEQFENELFRAGIFAVEGTARMFVDHWYDGVDPTHLNISLIEAGYE